MQNHFLPVQTSSKKAHFSEWKCQIVAKLGQLFALCHHFTPESDGALQEESSEMTTKILWQLICTTDQLLRGWKRVFPSKMVFTEWLTRQLIHVWYQKKIHRKNYSKSRLIPVYFTNNSQLFHYSSGLLLLFIKYFNKELFLVCFSCSFLFTIQRLHTSALNISSSLLLFIFHASWTRSRWKSGNLSSTCPWAEPKVGCNSLDQRPVSHFITEPGCKLINWMYLFLSTVFIQCRLPRKAGCLAVTTFRC